MTVDKGFLWGGATAAYQCEGAWDADGKVSSNWDWWLHERGLPNADVASDHYHHVLEDIALAKEGGHTAYRFSLSWPRIIKDREGTVNEAGIAFYNKIIDACAEAGIEPFVTVFHWDLPVYWEELGGWTNTQTALAFEHYARVCYEAFGDRVRSWVTINEPKWFTSRGYLVGDYPPFHQNAQEYIQAGFNIMLASALGVKVFREGGFEGSIGIVHSYTPVYGIDDTIESQIAVRYADNFNNNWVLDTAVFGEFPIDLVTELSRTYDLSCMKPEYLRIIKANTVDFLGLNYYSSTDVKAWTEGETTLRFNTSGKGGERGKIMVKGWFEQVYNPHHKFTDWGMEIYPEGLYHGLKKAFDKYHVPLYISENGIGCYEDITDEPVHDDYRISFLQDHIAAMLDAMDDGVDMRGYFVWSLFDLYSWISGMEKRYGLIGVTDDEEHRRVPKDSFAWFKRVIETGGDCIDRSQYKDDPVASPESA